MSINHLLEILDSLVDIHESLLELAKQKTPVLVKNRLDELNSISHKENKLVKHVDELNQNRIQFTAEYLISRGYRPDQRVTISDLIKIVFKAEDKKNLQDRQQRLMKKLTELRQHNDLNQKLIKQSLAYINYSIDLIVAPIDQDPIYHNPNQQTYNSARSGMFDTRA